MRRSDGFFIHGLALAISVSFLTAADDVQVIKSRRSTLSIYEYGGREPSRALPEYRRSSRSFRYNSGALTDVSFVGPLPVPPIKAPSHTSGSTTHPISAPESPQAPNELPAPQSVTIGWNASAEQSVAGYHVYIGKASGSYYDGFTVGNQTTAQVLVGQTTLYVAVSAFTSEGLESALSDELIVLGSGSQTSATSGAGRTSGSGLH